MSTWKPARSRGGRVAATLALLIAVGVVVTIVLRPGSPSPSRPTDAAGSSSATATVQRRDLVQTDTESGTLGHGNPQTVYDRLSGTITWLPSVGQVIAPGQALFRVAGQPVILMNGSTPAYRDLGSSDSDAQDVLQLNRNLVALGFNSAGIVVDDAWQAATTAGVDDLQASLGETETGTLKLGQVVFLSGDRLVSSVAVQLGSQAALRTVLAPTQFVSLTTTGTITGTATATTTTTTTTATTTTSTTERAPRKPRHTPQLNTLAPLVALLRAESTQLKAAEAQLRAAAQSKTPQTGGGTAAADGSGGSGGSATPVLTTSSVQAVVTVELDPSKQREAKVGEHVTVELPSGRTVSGRISAVSSIAQSPGGTSGNGGGGANTNGSGSSDVPVTITLRGRASGKGLDQASVSVNFAAARARNVLTLPVTALLAIQGGRYALQETSSPPRLISVTPGLFAAGYVEVSGRGIYPGLVVSDSQG
jgi:predicted membrane protein